MTSSFSFFFVSLVILFVLSDCTIPSSILPFSDSLEGGMLLSVLTLALFWYEGVLVGLAMFVLSYVLVVRSAEDRNSGRHLGQNKSCV